MKIRYTAFAAVVLVLGSPAFAKSPFDGTWSLNTSKSHLEGDTLSYADAGSGTLKYTDSDETYDFKPDGSSFTTPAGSEKTFLKTGDGSYTETSKKGGVLLATTSMKVSSDGKTLMMEVKGTKPNGDSFDNALTYARTSPGAGLIGGWKSTEIKLSSPNSLTVQTDSSDGVTLMISAVKATCEAKWGGKDFPASGPTVSDGLTLALSRTGQDSFKMVQKMKGKVILIASYRIGNDGKTLVMRGTDGEGKEPFTEVFEKQS